MVGTKVFDETWGWGEIVAETENAFVVVYDANPWGYHEFAK